MLKSYLNQRFFAFIILIFCSGSSLAMILPIMSLFLTNEVGVNDFQLGLFFTCSSIFGIFVSQVIARFSDERISRRLLIMLGYFAGALMALTYIICPKYEAIITIGIIFSSISMIATPQVFALAREYALFKYGDALMFTSYIRAVFSLSWVIIPPFTYFLFTQYGSFGSFSMAIGLFVTAVAVTFFTMPAKVFAGHDEPSSAVSGGAGNEKAGQLSLFRLIATDKSIIYLFIVFLFLWCCNTAYLISMPIYITRELGLDKSLPGYMMGTAALLEIPVMIIGGVIAKRTGLKNMLLFSCFFGWLFYLLISVVPLCGWVLLVLQLFNALFIGILASLGMVYMQELLPSVPGQATTLYNNSVNTGNIISGMMVTLLMSLGSARYVFYCGTILTLIALLLLLMVRKVKL